jgi:hypothetical protein
VAIVICSRQDWRNSAGFDFVGRLSRPVDGAGLAVFRIAFGLLMFAATVRFVAKGWVDELLLSPSHHFTYFGFDWVAPLPRPAMYACYGLIGLFAASIALGFYTRWAALGFCVLFTYAELIDKTTYLNHYYFVSLVSLLLAFVPAGAIWSLDARRRGNRPVTLASYALLRAQLAIVYGSAGLAKLNGDWLLRGEPLSTWLRAKLEMPLVGPLLGEPWVALAMSWAGAAFDLTVVPLLCFRRTRPYAVALAVLFHGAIWLLFPIGIFSFVMLIAIGLFFSPDWPRKWLAPSGPLPSLDGAARRPWWFGLAAAYLAIQVLLPLRYLLYPGPVNWTEEGFRFAWRVMLVEKTGQVEYEISSEVPRRRFRVLPRAELTPLQVKMLSTQPDLIQDYARHLAERYEALGYQGVRVRADAWVAFNGRPSQRLVDPGVDLGHAPRSLAPKPWIVPLSTESSPRGGGVGRLF